MLIFLYIESIHLGYGLGTSPNKGGGNVRDLLALTRVHAQGLLGVAKASLRLALGTSL